MTFGARVVATLIFLLAPPGAGAYSVLTHEAIVDSVWEGSIQPALLRRFPDATPDQLSQARGYVYGGCIIQDLGYYPLGSHFFSDLVHYVRSADFIQALLDESQNLNEYAFALGAVAHYGADVDGHAIAVNRAVPVLYPALRRRFGDEVTYADNPAAHLRTEFGFDVLQVARGHYASQAYHDFVGFQVSKDVLDRAFQNTYGMKLADLFLSIDLALGTYRFSVSQLLPAVTRTAWQIKRAEITQLEPNVSRKQFLYNIRRANYNKEWGAQYQRPGFGARLMAFIFRLIPKVGPFSGLGLKVPTPQTEKMFEDSFDSAVKRDKDSFAEAASTGKLQVANRDLDTGKPVRPGEYALTDKTYDKLVVKLAKQKFEGVTPELRADILGFYAKMKTPDPHGVGPEIEALKALKTIAPR
jgi:hypothetical protein